jgi:hypothetical protein
MFRGLFIVQADRTEKLILRGTIEEGTRAQRPMCPQFFVLAYYDGFNFDRAWFCRTQREFA